ncbi:hypothetical protein H7U19_08280 [Hyunsoonleella sp. SJ7]|uniref:Uncharacterized protein n=1 Tax=Hyunsoonleella aquatilis TaxID=2762758 RepID=A0A923HC48_9FLAO|nr:hypothetical protein [Hyunsoonleella aquatilis]MBC3758396.1 hypothetical protein [Hyunsoonleella aquatilis]
MSHGIEVQNEVSGTEFQKRMVPWQFPQIDMILAWFILSVVEGFCIKAK